ncbi:MAG: RES family NAD+ phosphorylase [Acidobacteria bacterium]|nr:RES family NAD+ phosphorylase [Acidobacteriota bacterium]
MADLVEIVAYRLTKQVHAGKLDGVGAARDSARRWNAQGQFVTYTSSSRALAVLEVRAGLPDGPPEDYVFSVIRVLVQRDRVRRIRAAELPDGWRDPGDVSHCQLRGASWYSDYPEEEVLEVPSVVVPRESNFVIRAGAAGAQVAVVEPFDFDPRLWGGPVTPEPASCTA